MGPCLHFPQVGDFMLRLATYAIVGVDYRILVGLKIPNTLTDQEGFIKNFNAFREKILRKPPNLCMLLKFIKS